MNSVDDLINASTTSCCILMLSGICEISEMFTIILISRVRVQLTEPLANLVSVVFGSSKSAIEVV
jgi:hypothetical protein